jgi:hypothetical protein
VNKITLILLTVLLYSTQGLGNIVGRLELKNTNIKTGDVFEGTIYFNPIPEQMRPQFYALAEKMIGEKFQLLFIKSLRPNINNVDVLELKGLFAVLIDGDLDKPQYVNLGQEKILINITNKKIIKTMQDKKKLIIIEQDYNSLPFTPIEKTIMLILFLIGVYFVVIFITNKKIKKKNAESKKLEFNKWNEIFLSAKSRESYEYIYFSRDVWTNIIDRQTPPIIEFNRMMHLHQYKKNWSAIEEQDVEITFDNIRGIFK